MSNTSDPTPRELECLLVLVGNDLANNPAFNGTMYGLPDLTPDEHSECGGVPSLRACTWKGNVPILRKLEYPKSSANFISYRLLA